MSFIGSFTGSDQRNDLQRAKAQADAAAAGGYGTAQSDIDAAGHLYDPYAQQGQRALDMYGAATGVNGADAYKSAVSGFMGDPFRQANEDAATRTLSKMYAARGGLYSGNAMMASARGSLERGSTDWNNWLNRLQGQTGMGYSATGAQAGLKAGAGQLAYNYGNDVANRDTSFGNAMAASDSTLWNNLIGIGGTAVRAFTPGYGGATPAGNIAGGVTNVGNAMYRGANNISGYFS